MTPNKEHIKISGYINLTNESLTYRKIGYNRRIIGKWGMMRNSQAPYSSYTVVKGQNRLDKFHTMAVL